MTDQGYGQWEYRVAIAHADDGHLESVDGGIGALRAEPGSSDSMTIIQALDVWGALGWELVGIAPLRRGRLQYVLKRPRHQGGWEGARIHAQRQAH